MQYEDEAITAVRATGEMPATGAHPRALGQLLLRQSPLTEQQLEDGLRVQREEGGRIGEILVRRNYVTEEQMLHALAAQLDLPMVTEINPEACDAELATRVPINFARHHRLMPIRRNGRGVEVAVADPLDVHALDDVRRALGAEILPLVAPSAKIVEAINKVYARQEGGGVDLGEGENEMDGEAEELTDILDLTDEAPIIRWVNSLMFNAVKERASDIHIEPREKELIVRYRVDGNLMEVKRANRNYVNSILSRVKIMAGLNIAEKRLPQDGRIRRKIAGKDIDMRVATAPGGQRRAHHHSSARSTRACSTTWPTSASARITWSSSTSSSIARTASSWSPAPPARARRRRCTPAWRGSTRPTSTSSRSRTRSSTSSRASRRCRSTPRSI